MAINNFVRLENNLDISEQFLFCEMLKTTIQKYSFIYVKNYFVGHIVSWVQTAPRFALTDSSIKEEIKGVLVFMREVYQSVLTTHYFLHRVALSMRTIDREQLEHILRITIAMIN